MSEIKGAVTERIERTAADFMLRNWGPVDQGDNKEWAFLINILEAFGHDLVVALVELNKERMTAAGKEVAP